MPVAMRNSLTLLLLVCAALPAVEDPFKTNAAYDRMRRNVGIGLGTLIWCNVNEGRGLLPQILAATTNGTSGNQTFAVTTGTSGADRWTEIVRNESVQDYVAGNLDALARDIAAGHGESLDALVELLAVPVERREAVMNALRARHAEIFAHATTTAPVVVERLADVVVESV
jgi:hypothetical protein